MKNATLCYCKLTVRRYDGEAVLSKDLKLPRAPVAGDLVLTLPEGWISDIVKQVTLTAEDDEHIACAWVDLEDDVDEFDDEWDVDETWECGIREPLQEAIKLYLDEGWEANISAVWIPFGDGGMWGNAEMFIETTLPGLGRE